jgi:hypothetical protein
VELVHLPPSEQRALAFLDKRYVSKTAERLDLPIAKIAEAFRSTPAESCAYIFHSAYCGSTLLSRALDIDGVATAFKEPQVFIDLAHILPKSLWPTEQRLALGAVLDLLQRPRRPGEKAVIKPSNYANPLIGHMMEMRPDSHALLMYAPLPSFLQSVARGRRWSWARHMIGIYRRHAQFETEQPLDLVLLTDIEIAAFLWLQQQAQFARLLREMPSGRLATLRADAFMAEPSRTIAATARFFELAISEDEADAIASGPLFRSHSKWQDKGFDKAARKREDALVKLSHGNDIERVIEWTHGIAREAMIPMDLPAPLLG